MLRRVGLPAVLGAALVLTGCTTSGSTSTPVMAAPASASAVSAGAVPAGGVSAGAAEPSSSPSPTAAVEVIPDHYDATRDPGADLQAALARAAADHKEVLVDFGADWCPDCRVLDELFRNASTNALLQKDYHVVAVDVGQFDHNLDFTAKYVKLRSSGIPALAVLTPTGKVRVATDDGAFADARTMTSKQVDAFLTRWAATT